MPTVTQEQAKILQQVAAENQLILEQTQWQWAQFANSLSSGNNATYALNTVFRFNLANTSGYLRGIRIRIAGNEFSNSNSTTAGALNRNGFYQMLGSLVVRLGNAIYRVPGGAMALLWQTYSSGGRLPDYRGAQSYAFSSSLSDIPTSVAASGNATWTSYVDIPFAVLQAVKNPEGIAPTLANTGMEVEFTTPSTLQGDDPFLNPFTSAGTLSLTTGGTISVWGLLARQVTVASNQALSPFIVGPAYVFEDVPQTFVQGPAFYPFQGQESALILVKSIVVLDSPGELSGEYSDPQNLARMDLMYDANTPVYENSNSQNPYYATNGGLTNWLIDSGQAIGDQPPGVYVFDFGRGTDAAFPNSSVYFNLEQFTKAGLRIHYAVAPKAGAQIHFLNQYVVPNFFKALKAAG